MNNDIDTKLKALEVETQIEHDVFNEAAKQVNPEYPAKPPTLLQSHLSPRGIEQIKAAFAEAGYVQVPSVEMVVRSEADRTPMYTEDQGIDAEMEAYNAAITDVRANKAKLLGE